jgi:hypothetical protein
VKIAEIVGCTAVFLMQKLPCRICLLHEGLLDVFHPSQNVLASACALFKYFPDPIKRVMYAEVSSVVDVLDLGRLPPTEES